MKCEMKDNTIELEFKPILIDDQKYTIKRDNDNQWPVRFYTATMDMRDFIGNIVSVHGSKYVVNGVYRGVERTVDKCRSLINLMPQDRIMATEHVNVNGEFEFLLTKNRILIGDTNFVNIGFSNNEKCKYLRIDLYTGESKMLECEPVFSFLR